MTIWHRLLLGVGAMALSSSANAQPAPPTAPPPKDAAPGMSAEMLDRAAAEVLKEVHNRGADLYNRGDPVAAYRLYEGALSAVRPFVAHRPDVLKAVEDGLNETAKADGSKIQAFRLHEVIEQVRASLKKADAATAAPLVTPEKPTRLAAPEKPVRPKQSPKAGVNGVVTLDGKPLAGVDVTAVSLGQRVPRVYTATTDAAGAFAFPAGVPAGRYAVMVTGKGVPEKFTTVGTSPLRTEMSAGGPNAINVDLK
jgi:hypothetical protein